MSPRPPVLGLALLLACAGGHGPAAHGQAIGQAIDQAVLEAAVTALDTDAVERIGSDAMPVLVRMYREAAPDRRARIAAMFYRLGWKSEEAKGALMEDIHTTDEMLRIRVQWALGRVSNDDDVVDALLDNMRNGFNARVRDKAGCGLAYDQIHLTDRQKASLYRRLIERLEDPSTEQRSLAIRVLKAHTGQTRGFHPLVAKPEALESWQRWIEEFEAAVAP
jgi:hypothetical protein